MDRQHDAGSVAGSGRERLLAVLLLGAGFAGIAYEVLYGRMLGDRVGSQFIVNAAILLTFLVGIGIGTLIAHRLWSLLPWVEVAIGGYALIVAASIDTIDRFLYRLAAVGGGTMIVPLLGCVLLLVVPAVLIGVSLPVLSGYMALLRRGPVFCGTYAAYNLGAALVVLASEYVLIRVAGIRAAMVMVALVDLAVAVAVAVWFADLRRRRPPPVAAGRLAVPRRWLAALVTASVASAVFQLLLVKLAECVFGPFRDTFALVLGVILAGITAGSWTVRRWRWDFATLMVLNCGGLLIVLLGFAPAVRLYAAWHEAVWPVALKLGFLVLLAGVPAATFGATIPALLVRQRHVARESGWLLFWSSMANGVGFLLMVFWLHPRLDYGVIVAVVAALSGCACLIFSPRTRRAGLAVALALAAGVACVTVWDEDLLYLGHTAFDSVADLDKTRTSITLPEKFKGPQDVFSIVHSRAGPRFFINGYISMVLDSPWEPLVGAVASVYAPRLDRALVLGVGSGNTAAVAGLLFDHTDGVEINGAVLANLHRMRPYNFDIEHNPRVTLIHDDAIHFVKATTIRYSLVINTVTTPLYFSSAKLYTVDFLQAVKKRLSDGGLYVTWVDSRVGDEGIQIMLRTLTRTFRHVALSWVRSSYFLLLCSDVAIAPRNAEALARHPVLADAFRRRFQIEPGWVAYNLLVGDVSPLVGDPAGPVNRLDYPALEFAMSRLRHRGYDRFKTAVEMHQDLGAVEQRLAPYLDFDPVAFVVHAERLLGDCRFTRRWRRQAAAGLPNFAERRRQVLVAVERRLAEAADSADAFHKAGFRLLTAGLYREAIDLFQKALQKDPHRNNSYFNIGACYEYLGEYEAALENYRRELTVDPDDEDVAYRLGRVYVKMNDFDQAVPLLEGALQKEETPNRYYYLGRARLGLGQVAAARRSFERGLELDPDNDRLRRALEEMAAR